MVIFCNERFEGPLDIDAPGVRRGGTGVFVICCDCTDGTARMVAAEYSVSMDRDLKNPQNRKRWSEPYDGPLIVFVWYPAESSTSGTASSLAMAIRERYVPWCARTPNQRGEHYEPG